MSNIDRIVEILRDYQSRDLGHPSNRVDIAEMIDAELHPVIETVEQLDALPMRSIVRCARGFAWAKHSPNPKLPGATWYDAGCEDPQYPDEVPLPATVLHTPEDRDG